ncbi:DUF1573 domain-containing protein [Neorhodopirellula lusitana]|uniref:DUF1573 domain-containing protein n=1 Tax=Neorhodopirellula lusitana TaxID=445327 RepID=UPI00384FE95D
MKTFLACLIFAAIGATVAWKINYDRYGKYEGYFGPMDVHGEVTAKNALASMRKNWTDTATPRVELPDGHSYDFGVMSPEEEGEHIFVVKNTGEADLSLKVGASTCKCTVGELGKESLAPGEQTEVKMSWTVKTNESSFGQSAELRTNDPAKVAIRFEISGQVVRQVQLFPEQVTFGEVAAGENIEVQVRVYSYLDYPVKAGNVKFTDELLNELASIEVEEFEPGNDDGVNEAAKQGFLVKALVKPGLKQGPVNDNISLELQRLDEDGNVVASSKDSKSGDTEEKDDDATGEDLKSLDDPSKLYVFAPVSGRIVGALSMLPNSKLRGVSGGGYIFDFGKVGKDDSLTAKSFVSLKGQQKDSTNLKIGEVSPAEYVEATLAKPIGRGQMTLYGLTLKLKPGAEKVERLGMNRDDYGFVMIESDNPKVPPLKMRLKFSLSAR